MALFSDHSASSGKSGEPLRMAVRGCRGRRRHRIHSRVHHTRTHPRPQSRGDRNAAWLRGLARAPRVDVLIATYNEEEAILARTIVGALGIDFPGLRVWVLDDGQRPWVERLCRSKHAH